MRAGGAALAAILLAGAVLPGCGGAVSDEEAVAESVLAYLHDVINGYGDAACEWLTEQQADAVVVGARAKLPELKATSCADALTKVGKRLAPEVKERLRYSVVMNVRAEDGRARAELLGGTTVIRLVRDDGLWLISSGLNLWTAKPYRGDEGRAAGSGTV